MQRKLVSFDIFETIEKNSLFNALIELDEASELLGNALNVDLVSVHCYDGNSVVYECQDGTFIKATYTCNDKEIKFNNIEELVIDEETETESRKATIAEMVDALQNGEEGQADLSWDKLKLMLERVMKRGRAKKKMADMYDDNFKKAGKNMACEAAGSVFVRRGAKNMAKSLAAKSAWGKRRHKEPSIRAKMRSRLEMYRSNRKRLAPIGKKAAGLRKSGLTARAYYTRAPKGKVNEWCMIIENFYNYVGNTQNDSAKVAHNESGDVISVSIPTKQVRNEGKVIKIKLDTLKADVKVLREAALRAVGTPEFSKAVSQLKRNNNISDNDALEECIGNIVGKFPSIIALSENELAIAINSALKFAGEHNFDDSTCIFMAEALLRTSFEAFPEKVDTILRLSETQYTGNEDAYLDFQERVAGFYKNIDESISAEIKLTSDLYNAIAEVGSMAEDVQDNETKTDTSILLNELEPSLEGKYSVSMDTAEVATEWLMDFVDGNLNEGNLETDNGWSFYENPPTSATGDFDAVGKLSSFNYNPKADLQPGTKSHQLAQDSMNMDSDDAIRHGWSNAGPKGQVWDDTDSGLKNPYQLSSLRPYEPKGEPESDSGYEGDAHGTKQIPGMTSDGGFDDSKDSLRNPFLPKSLKPHTADTGVDKWMN